MNAEKLCYAVVMLKKDGGLRAAPELYDDYGDATSGQMKLGALNKLPSWIMAFPDPRQVSND